MDSDLAPIVAPEHRFHDLGPQRLAERAGPARAKELVYTGERYSAATLERWNVVNRVLPDDGFAAAARDYARRRHLPFDRMPRILGWGQTTAAMELSRKLSASAEAECVLPVTRQAIRTALGRSGLPDCWGLDAIETHDGAVQFPYRKTGFAAGFSMFPQRDRDTDTSLCFLPPDE